MSWPHSRGGCKVEWTQMLGSLEGFTFKGKGGLMRHLRVGAESCSGSVDPVQERRARPQFSHLWNGAMPSCLQE